MPSKDFLAGYGQAAEDILAALRDEFLREHKGYLHCECGACVESMGCEFVDLVPSIFGEEWNPRPAPQKMGSHTVVDMGEQMKMLDAEKTNLSLFLGSLSKHKLSDSGKDSV